jgi:hypothetical protein
MGKYDYDVGVEVPFFSSLVRTVCFQAHTAGAPCVNGTSVIRLSADGKTPLVLQVRAAKPFKKGTLLLAPAFGEIVVAVADEKEKPKAKGALDISMIQSAAAMVHAGPTDKRRKSDIPAKTVHLQIHSPLLAGGKAPQDAAQLPPFWAVLRCCGPSSCHNMDKDLQMFTVGNVELNGSKAYNKVVGLDWTVELPILKNVFDIEQNDVLCFPWSTEF